VSERNGKTELQWDITYVSDLKKEILVSLIKHRFMMMSFIEKHVLTAPRRVASL
jgi:hypothetical protein